MQDAYMADGELLSDEVEVDLNVFCLLMLNWVCGQVDSTNIVTVYRGTAAKRAVKFLQQLAQPTSFSDSICNGAVFSFGT